MLNLFSICFFMIIIVIQFQFIDRFLAYQVISLMIQLLLLKVSITLIVYCLLLMVLLFSMLRFTLRFYYHQELLVFFLLQIIIHDVMHCSAIFNILPLMKYSATNDIKTFFSCLLTLSNVYCFTIIVVSCLFVDFLSIT